MKCGYIILGVFSQLLVDMDEQALPYVQEMCYFQIRLSWLKLNIGISFNK